ncbi:hypothetical protein [Phocaeicola sp.]|uniref:hypothetical protein n=1 Tax=Phocaeicola sp. TaxID=2773926 RepID=UPI0026230AFA|nr:hypothetical protein [Phocaeicola sp.]
MKHSKKILILWTSAAIVAMLWGGIALHGNARQGRAEAKKMAIQTLRSVAEQAVNREFEKLEIYRFLENKGDKKHTKRKNISKAGEFEIEVDSLKETQGLYPLEIAGTKANILDDLGKFPLEQIGSQWKAEMNARYGGMVCALSLEVHPLGSDDVRKVSVEDTTIIASRYDLGTYYLDDMYTMQLTAYALPGFWCCVDWANPLLWAMSGLFLCIACQEDCPTPGPGSTKRQKRQMYRSLPIRLADVSTTPSGIRWPMEKKQRTAPRNWPNYCWALPRLPISF